MWTALPFVWELDGNMCKAEATSVNQKSKTIQLLETLFQIPVLWELHSLLSTQTSPLDLAGGFPDRVICGSLFENLNTPLIL